MLLEHWEHVILVIFLWKKQPDSNHEAYRQTQIERHLQNKWPVLVKSVQIMKVKEKPMQHSKLKIERQDIQMHALELDIFDTKDVIATIGSQFPHL